MHTLALILVIVGAALAALDWILGYSGRGRGSARPLGLLHLAVILIAIGVILGVKTVSS